MQLQVQISGIENGVLVMTKPKPSLLSRPSSQQEAEQQAQESQIPTTQYCSDFDELVAYLKSVWPVEVR